MLRYVCSVNRPIRRILFEGKTKQGSCRTCWNISRTYVSCNPNLELVKKYKTNFKSHSNKYRILPVNLTTVFPTFVIYPKLNYIESVCILYASFCIYNIIYNIMCVCGYSFYYKVGKTSENFSIASIPSA